MLTIKIKRSLLGMQCWFSFDKISFPGSMAIMIHYVYAGIFFFPQTLMNCVSDSFNVLCSDCAENHASPEQFLKVVWKAGLWAAGQYCFEFFFSHSQMDPKYSLIFLFPIIRIGTKTNGSLCQHI